MVLFSYKVEHDYGLAPNPFHGYCTLAVCKSNIRKNKNLVVGDWIIGTGSKSLKNVNRLVYAMHVEEIVLFNDYWNDIRFQIKKPIINGSIVQMYGDNIYHQDEITGEWIQENSAHSSKDGTPNIDHKNRDISGLNVLISKEFYYFGHQSQIIPDSLVQICSNGRGYKSIKIPIDIRVKFIEWINTNFEIGIHGDPINWDEHSYKETIWKS